MYTFNALIVFTMRGEWRSVPIMRVLVEAARSQRSWESQHDIARYLRLAVWITGNDNAPIGCTRYAGKSWRVTKSKYNRV